MSMAMVAHVREKSNARNSARTLLLNLAIYANDCCGVAWPADATLRHETNVSHQRIHELKRALQKTGELVIVERPGFTNLYLVAWQGTPLGGTSHDTGRHDPSCPLRHAHAPAGREGSEIPDTPMPEGILDTSEPQGSDISKRRGQIFLRRKPEKTREENRAPVAIAPREAKAEAQSPYWCDACGYAAPRCEHRIRYREEVSHDAHTPRPSPTPGRDPRRVLRGGPPGHGSRRHVPAEGHR